ncbi:MAG: hypothetical protein V1845_03270 [bacterium]
MGGKCVICGVVAEEDGICGECGDPLKIIVTCTACGAKMDITNQDQELIEATFHKKIENRRFNRN